MLTADVMFVIITKLMIMSERKLRFVTVKNITSWKEHHLSKILNKVIKLYI